MPDEIPFLVTEFLSWFHVKLNFLLAEKWNEETMLKVISFAGEAHTKFVHIHPFPDGNGRLARILSGLVLQQFGLPLPMFLKENRSEYMRAVSRATIDGNYDSICKLHTDATQRTAKMLTVLWSE